MRLIAYHNARNDLATYAQVMNPDQNEPDNIELSSYDTQPHHRLIAEALEEIERGDNLRLAIAMPPQHGKTEMISRLFPSWAMGRRPDRNIMVGGYSQDFVEQNISTDVRSYFQHENYPHVFPGVTLRRDSKSKEYMQTLQGGRLSFLGRGGAGTGKNADIFLIDDPLKDDVEAQSSTTRQQVYSWFTKVANTRVYKTSAIIVVHTRWHEDDLIGRLCDPDHPDYDRDIAGDWKYLNIPAVVDDPALAKALGLTLEAQTDPFIIKHLGSQPMAPLWGARFSLRQLAMSEALDPRGFMALYMGRPSPEDGDYFKRDDIRYYDREDLPADLNIYAASDHALSEKTSADPSCLGCIGIDSNDDIYILPDLVWAKIPTDRTVSEMILMMKRNKPRIWFAESDNIQKSIGPFLRKEMQKQRVYTPILAMSTAKADKPFRARSIQGRVQLGKVYFPRFAPWTEKAVQEMLKFPNGAKDDFCDWLAWIGIGLDSELAATVSGPASVETPTRGTFKWLKWQTKSREQRAATARGGW